MNQGRAKELKRNEVIFENSGVASKETESISEEVAETEPIAESSTSTSTACSQEPQ